MLSEWVSGIKETDKSCHLLMSYFIDEELYIQAIIELYPTSLIYLQLNLLNILDQAKYPLGIDSLSKVV